MWCETPIDEYRVRVAKLDLTFARQAWQPLSRTVSAIIVWTTYVSPQESCCLARNELESIRRSPSERGAAYEIHRAPSRNLPKNNLRDSSCLCDGACASAHARSARRTRRICWGGQTWDPESRGSQTWDRQSWGGQTWDRESRGGQTWVRWSSTCSGDAAP